MKEPTPDGIWIISFTGVLNLKCSRHVSDALRDVTLPLVLIKQTTLLHGQTVYPYFDSVKLLVYGIINKLYIGTIP